MKKEKIVRLGCFAYIYLIDNLTENFEFQDEKGVWTPHKLFWRFYFVEKDYSSKPL